MKNKNKGYKPRNININRYFNSEDENIKEKEEQREYIGNLLFG